MTDRMDHLKTLCQICGTSGDESSVRNWILEHLPPDAEAQTDPLGNLLVFRKGKRRPDRRLMLAAHMDEVGLIITSIAEDGTLRFGTVGGIDPRVLAGRSVTVGKAAYPGVIGTKAVHRLSAKEKDQALDISAMYVDIGASSRQEAEKLVRLGDRIHFLPNWHCFGQDKICCKALDDRFGCLLLLELLQTEQPFDAWYCFTVQEEIGLRGAMTATYTVAPDLAIVLETTTAADLPDVPDQQQVCKLGKGAVVSYMDGRTMYDRELYQFTMETAKELQIPVQTKSKIAGGNDAGAIQTAGNGVRVMAISAPARYLHSGVVVVQKQDLDACADLAAAMLERLGTL